MAQKLKFTRDYKGTLEALDSFILLGKIPKHERPIEFRQSNNVIAMKEYIDKLGLDLNQLRYIHVAGTKGKGSTCAFCESILRKAGLKTGLFTSPHLVDVRERIKINGESISKEKFVKIFWECYDALASDSKNVELPSLTTYFRFLTLLCFKAFLEEKVDVAILEVGMGGRLDSTNVIHPTVCGITSLGLDHVEILGNTLDKIAFEKAGIMKKGVPVITVPQKEEAIPVLKKCASAVEAPLYLTPNFIEITKSDNIPLGLEGEHQKINSALALCLSHQFLQKYRNLGNENEEPIKMVDKNSGIQIYPPFKLEEFMIQGLIECKFEGRAQVLFFKNANIRFHLDGAHTMESIEVCVDWFIDSIKRNTYRHQEELPESSLLSKILSNDEITIMDLPKFLKNESIKILIFNYTDSTGRNAENLLKVLAKNEHVFDFVLFCPKDSSKNTLHRHSEPNKEEMRKLLEIYKSWNKIVPNGKAKAFIVKSINTVLKWLWMNEGKTRIDILVTGSLYLVGDFLQKLKY